MEQLEYCGCKEVGALKGMCLNCAKEIKCECNLVELHNSKEDSEYKYDYYYCKKCNKKTTYTWKLLSVVEEN